MPEQVATQLSMVKLFEVVAYEVSRRFPLLSLVQPRYFHVVLRAVTSRWRDLRAETRPELEPSQLV